MKRILQFISCLGLMFFSLNVYSQSDLTPSSPLKSEFLKNYRPPNFNYFSWSLSPNVRESGTDATNFERMQFNLSISSAFSLRQQKDKSNTVATIYTGNIFRRGNTNGVKNGNENFYNNFTSINASRDFFLKDKFFLSAGLGQRLEFDRKLIETWSSDLSNETFVNLGIGYGRVFLLNSAWRAQTILNDLECNGIAVDRSLLTELADLLNNQSNTRIFDSRLARIQFQSELYSFIQEQSIADFNPLTAAVINDTYAFENFRNRSRGYRVYAGLRPGHRSEVDKAENVKNKMADFYLYPIVEFEYHLPISEDWQFDVFSDMNFKSLINNNIFTNISSNVNVALAWLPNQRIRSTTSLVYRGNYEDNFEFSDVSLGYQLNYYFSPRASVDFSAVASKTWTELNAVKNNDLSQRITLGFNFQIF